MKKFCNFTLQIHHYEKQIINYYSFSDADSSVHRDYRLQM